MKFSRSVVMLVLFSSILFLSNSGDKKALVVEAASDLNVPDAKTDVVPTEQEKTDVVPTEQEKTDVVPTEQEKTDVLPTEQEKTDVLPTEQEKTLFSTILKSFKNGHVDLTTLASALNDPNINRLAASLSKANLTKLAAVLEEPQVDLSKLVAALSDPDLNLDKLVATFGDPTVLPPPNLKHASSDDTGIMAMMKSWASQIGESLKGHMTTATSPTGVANKNKNNGVEKAPIEMSAQKPNGGVSSEIPTGFERSTPSPDANTYGKSLVTGVEVTTGTTGNSMQTEEEGESAQSTFNHRLIYYVVAGVLGLSMCIFLATRLSKSYRGEEVEETRSSIRMVA